MSSEGSLTLLASALSIYDSGGQGFYLFGLAGGVEGITLKEAFTGGRRLWITVFGFASLMLLGGLGTFQSYKSFLDRSPVRTIGTVYMGGWYNESGDEVYTPMVYFIDRRGEQVSFSPVGYFSSLSEGQRLPVLYDPKNPTYARVDNELFPYTSIGLMIVGALVIVVFMLIIIHPGMFESFPFDPYL